MTKQGFFRRHAWALAPLVLLGAALFVWPKAAETQNGAPEFPRASLTIRRADGTLFPYQVEVATTMAQDMYGLMFRKSLPPDQGMIFIYKPDENVSMWMKNTYIPLDMLFVRRDGVIAKIITHAQPFDLTPLPSDEPVRAVIEINAGEAGTHGFKTGDQVLFPGFDAGP